MISKREGPICPGVFHLHSYLGSLSLYYRWIEKNLGLSVPKQKKFVWLPFRHPIKISSEMHVGYRDAIQTELGFRMHGSLVVEQLCMQVVPGSMDPPGQVWNSLLTAP